MQYVILLQGCKTENSQYTKIPMTGLNVLTLIDFSSTPTLDRSANEVIIQLSKQATDAS